MFLHFDLSQGCSIQALGEALINLGALATLSPISGALLQKAQTYLQDAGYVIKQKDSELLAQFCALLSNLNPSAVTATRIPLALAHDASQREIILKLSENIPVYEREFPAPSCDHLSLALLKACVSHFGARGESVLLKMGHSKNSEVKALWCQKTLETGPKIHALIEINAQVTNPHLQGDLIHRLNQIGAQKIWTSQIMVQGTHAKTYFQVIGSEADQNQLIEALLILGQASEVQIKTIEQHTLQKRIISIALGRPQKQQVCRVTEYLWGDRILRADPLAEDLEALSKSSGHPQEIIRADVLSAWKKRIKT